MSYDWNEKDLILVPTLWCTIFITLVKLFDLLKLYLVHVSCLLPMRLLWWLSKLVFILLSVNVSCSSSYLWPSPFCLWRPGLRKRNWFRKREWLMIEPGMVPFCSSFSCFRHIYCYELGTVVGPEQIQAGQWRKVWGALWYADGIKTRVRGMLEVYSVSPFHGISDGVLHKVPKSIMKLNNLFIVAVQTQIIPVQWTPVKAGFEHII